MKTLLLIRHAKSLRDPSLNMNDFERPLNKRGQKNAPEMANRTKKRGISPDLLISSPATRAISTARIFAATWNYPEEEIVQKKNIYASTTGTLLRVVNEIDKQFNTVFIFGHNPEMSNFVYNLSNEDPGHFPTCAVARIDFEADDWEMISYGLGELRYIDYPKKV